MRDALAGSPMVERLTLDQKVAGSSPAPPANALRNAYANTRERRCASALARYRRKRQTFIMLLGGECVQCGATQRLEFDHINRSEKLFTITSCWDYPAQVMLAELAKCQLLCKPCHKAKTLVELTGPRAHGTWGQYTNGKCRCRVCKDFFNAYKRSLRAKKKAAL